MDSESEERGLLMLVNLRVYFILHSVYMCEYVHVNASTLEVWKKVIPGAGMGAGN